MPRFPSAQGRLNHDPGFHLSCDENLSEGWGPPLFTFSEFLERPPKPGSVSGFVRLAARGASDRR